MSLSRLLASLNQIPQAGSYAMCKIVSYEDDQSPGHWYILLVNHNLLYPVGYVDSRGAISATFLLDSSLRSSHVHALITFNDATNDIVFHHLGVGQLHLPGIANSAGIKHGIVDIELSVSQFLQRLPTSCPAVAMANLGTQKREITPEQLAEVYRNSLCDCGGHKLGYKDDELHGHGRWCKLVKDASGRQA